MSSIKIYLCDLTHTGKKISNDNIPLGIGYIATYAKKIFLDKLEISLFKYPETLSAAVSSSPPDILGCANYCWNDAINSYFFEKAKSTSRNIITIAGGPNFPLELEDRIEYLKDHPFTDFYIPKEGEI